MQYVKGNFRRYIFKSDKGYVVGLFKVKDTSNELKELKNKTITFTGYFSDLNESDLYLLNGSITTHERYGEQFAVESYEAVLPLEKDNIVEFLSSNLFKGISFIKANKIVDTLGLNCLNLIIDNPDILLTVPTITFKQKELIVNSLIKYQSSYENLVELTKLGFNSKDALIINNFYKSKTLDFVNENPYKLVDDIHEITFLKIDRIRHNFNINDNNINRIKAIIKYVFNEFYASMGNTYLSKLEIFTYTTKLLFTNDDDLVFEALNLLIDSKEIVVLDDMYFTKEMYHAENYIAHRVFKLANSENFVKATDKDIDKLESYFNIKYSVDQKNAIKASLNYNFLVITGGPGTGKTTIIQGICKLYQNIYKLDDKKLIEDLVLLAPTGRAAKRISEQTNLPSSTIHRFLKWNKESDTFSINEDNPSDAKFVIIDESSMIDTNLFYNLLLGLNYGTKIIMIGDSNQLPSVGPGQVLKDIIDSDVVNTIKLNKLYRQDETSNITLFAHSIINNQPNLELLNKEDDLAFIPADKNSIKDILEKYVNEFKKENFNCFQVLAPMYKGDNGIDSLNNYIQNIINPKIFTSNELMIDGVIFRENDKVLQLVNMLDENVFNGDIGKVMKVTTKPHKELIIGFDNNIVSYKPSNFYDIKLGYCISIHKSQGSEFDIVIIPVLNAYLSMLYKKLIYTAITRAKKKLIIIGELSSLQKAITNEKENNRKTNLKRFLTNRY